MSLSREKRRTSEEKTEIEFLVKVALLCFVLTALRKRSHTNRNGIHSALPSSPPNLQPSSKFPTAGCLAACLLPGRQEATEPW